MHVAYRHKGTFKYCAGSKSDHADMECDGAGASTSAMRPSHAGAADLQEQPGPAPAVSGVTLAEASHELREKLKETGPILGLTYGAFCGSPGPGHVNITDHQFCAGLAFFSVQSDGETSSSAKVTLRLELWRAGAGIGICIHWQTGWKQTTTTSLIGLLSSEQDSQGGRFFS